MQQVLLKDLLEAGCHFGHKSERWHPKAAQFIYQKRDGIHVIDLAKTKQGLEKAAEFIKNKAMEGKSVLFVGTKRQARQIVKEEASTVGASYISQRWIGGLLTNWEQVHKNLEKIRKLTEEEATNAWKKYPKHERVKLSRYLKKLGVFYGGIVHLLTPPDALFVIDIKREDIAVKEAKRTGVPIVAMVDTNSDPTGIDYVVPANDDAVGSIKFCVHYLAQAYLEGKEAFEKQQVDARKKQEAEAKKTVGQPMVQSQPKVAKVEQVDNLKKVATVEKVENNKVGKVEKVVEVEKVDIVTPKVQEKK